MSFFNKMFQSSSENPTSKIAWRQLTDLGQLNEIILASGDTPVIIFKHSTRCGISKIVLKQFENEFDLHNEITPYFLDLLSYRSLSNEIASKFGVTHQSPQLIVIKNGKAILNTSHESIDALQLNQFI